jgi:hypothetical protein
MAEYNPLIRNFITPKKVKQPRYSIGVDTCIECHRKIGLAYQTRCDNPICNGIVCLDCRRDNKGNAFRSMPYICSHCKQTQEKWLNGMIRSSQNPQTQVRAASVRDVVDMLIDSTKTPEKQDAFDKLTDELFR